MDILNLSISKFRNKVLKKGIFTRFRNQKYYGIIWSHNGKSAKYGISKSRYFPKSGASYVRNMGNQSAWNGFPTIHR